MSVVSQYLKHLKIILYMHILYAKIHAIVLPEIHPVNTARHVRSHKSPPRPMQSLIKGVKKDWERQPSPSPLGSRVKSESRAGEPGKSLLLQSGPCIKYEAVMVYPRGRGRRAERDPQRDAGNLRPFVSECEENWPKFSNTPYPTLRLLRTMTSIQ